MGECGKQSSLFIGALIFAGISLAVFTCIFFSMFYSPYKYTIGIDAGSSHSELVLYRWKVDKFNNTGLVEEVDKCDIDDGLAALNNTNLKKGLLEFIYCLEKLYDSVPLSVSRKEVNIYLGATAGARMLEMADPEWMKYIFNSLKRLFEEQNFSVEQVGIIDGSKEGLYAWISLNYLTQNLFSSLTGLKNSFTVLDQGGASAQIAQVLSSKIPDDVSPDVSNVTLYGRQYSVYTFSNLCFGANEWIQRYLTMLLRTVATDQVPAACFPPGYILDQSKHSWDSVCVQTVSGVSQSRGRPYSFIGTGDYQKCSQELETLINPQECLRNFKYCPKISEYRPESDTIYAISTYFYVMKGLGLKDKQLTKKDFVKRIHDVCEMNVNQLKNDLVDTKEKFLPYYCIKGVYMLKSLEEIYKFQEQDWPKMKFTNHIGHHSLGWLMGYIISTTNNIPARSLNHIFMISWLVYLSLFLFFGSLAALLAYYSDSFPIKKFKRHGNQKISIREDEDPERELKPVCSRRSPDQLSDSV